MFTEENKKGIVVQFEDPEHIMHSDDMVMIQKFFASDSKRNSMMKEDMTVDNTDNIKTKEQCINLLGASIHYAKEILQEFNQKVTFVSMPNIGTKMTFMLKFKENYSRQMSDIEGLSDISTSFN